MTVRNLPVNHVTGTLKVEAFPAALSYVPAAGQSSANDLQPTIPSPNTDITTTAACTVTTSTSYKEEVQSSNSPVVVVVVIAAAGDVHVGVAYSTVAPGEHDSTGPPLYHLLQRHTTCYHLYPPYRRSSRSLLLVVA